MPGLTDRAFVREVVDGDSGDDVDKREREKTHFGIEEEELVGDMGISGLSILAKRGWDMVILVCVAVVAFTIQYYILWEMSLYIRPEDEDASGREHRELPRTLVYAAVYLHVMNLLTDVLNGLMLTLSYRSLVKTRMKYAVISFPIFITDALITPIVTMVVGSLFLCGSDTVQDLLLNSCATAFVSRIDNDILDMGTTMRKMVAGHRPDRVIYIPYRPKVLLVLEVLTCQIPVLPCAFVYIICYVGLQVMQLEG